MQIQIDQVRLKIKSLDFRDVEIEILDLVIHHEFFWLERKISDKFIGKYGSREGKSSYNRKIKEIKSYKNSIRAGYGGKIFLSDFLSQSSDIKVFQLVSDLEKGD